MPQNNTKSTLPSLKNAKLNNNTILLRLDLNVPLKNGRITDLTKIKESLPTIKYLLKHQCTIFIITHLGEPQGINKKLSTKVLIKPLEQLLKRKIAFAQIKKLTSSNPKTNKETNNTHNSITLLENIRFEPEETTNNITLAKNIVTSTRADIYVNDAFAVCHRAHASITQIPTLLPSYAGLLLKKEITELNKALYPKHPAIWIIGGAKLSKLNIILSALGHADKVLLGGALCLPFLITPADEQTQTTVKKIKQHPHFKKIILPIDFACQNKTTNKITTNTIPTITQNLNTYDIGPKTIHLFQANLQQAKTIVWNGPLGYFEKKPFEKGTKEVISSIKKNQISICGGGETNEAVHQLKLKNKFTHISTGGGASLAYLCEEKLPGIEALKISKKGKNQTTTD